MESRALVDTGFLVTLLNRKDEHHLWATGLVPKLRGPWLTTEACVSESLFLLEEAGRPAALALLEWLSQGWLQSRPFLPEEIPALQQELFRHHNRRVDFADACLVLLSHRHPKLPLVTVDAADFHVYLRGRTSRKLIFPHRSH